MGDEIELGTRDSRGSLSGPVVISSSSGRFFQLFSFVCFIILIGLCAYITSAEIKQEDKADGPTECVLGTYKGVDGHCHACPSGCYGCTMINQNLTCVPCLDGWFFSDTHACIPCTTQCPEDTVKLSDCTPYADTECVAGLPGFSELTWSEIEGRGAGANVRWWMWNGDDNINGWVDNYVIPQMQQRYNITVTRVGITDSVEFVNQVQADKESGNFANGEIDIIWINGENFATMKTNNLLYGPFAANLPSSVWYDFNASYITTDFGVPHQNFEFPYNLAQVVYFYNSARVSAAPANMSEFFTWVKNNPGRFTYPAPPDFTGATFVRRVFYEYNGPYTDFIGPFNESLYNQRMQNPNNAFQQLRAIHPFIWTNGTDRPVYPSSQAEVDDLFASGQIDFTLNYDPNHGAALVDDGTWPDTTRPFVWSDGSISNVNFLAIPFNSPNKAAALTTINFIGSLEAVYSRAQPEVWGALPAFNRNFIPTAWQIRFDSIPRDSNTTLSLAELSALRLVELQASYTARIDDDWVALVPGNTTTP